MPFLRTNPHGARLHVFANTDTFSLRESFKEAFSRPFTAGYVRAAMGWFVLSVIFHSIHPFVGQLGSIITMTGVSVVWYRSLAFQEQSPLLRFSKREGIFLFYSLFMMMVALLIGLGITFVAARFGVAGLSLAGLLMTGASFWFMPFVFVFLGLIAMGFDDNRTIGFVKGIVLPIHLQLLFGYMSILLFHTCVVVGVALMRVDLGFFSILFDIIFIALEFLFAGVMVTFTSHVIYTRCRYEKP